MTTLISKRVISAPRWLCFEMIRNVDVHAAAVPEIHARAENGTQHGPLHLEQWTEWSAVYFGIRFRTTMKATGFDWPVRYVETNQGGPFRMFWHHYTLIKVDEEKTLLSDRMEFETGYGLLGHVVDQLVLAPRLQRALDIRMDHIKTWSEDGTWKKWITKPRERAYEH